MTEREFDSFYIPKRKLTWRPLKTPLPPGILIFVVVAVVLTINF